MRSHKVKSLAELLASEPGLRKINSFIKNNEVIDKYTGYDDGHWNWLSDGLPRPFKQDLKESLKNLIILAVKAK